jgi:hypothetical protein
MLVRSWAKDNKALNRVWQEAEHCKKKVRFRDGDAIILLKNYL